MTSFRPGHRPPHVTIAARTLDGSKCSSPRGPARWNARVSAALFCARTMSTSTQSCFLMIFEYTCPVLDLITEPPTKWAGGATFELGKPRSFRCWSAYSFTSVTATSGIGTRFTSGVSSSLSHPAALERATTMAALLAPARSPIRNMVSTKTDGFTCHNCPSIHWQVPLSSQRLSCSRSNISRRAVHGRRVPASSRWRHRTSSKCGAKGF